MSNRIRHKRSSTASAVPLTTDLELGELAINTNDGKLFLKKNDGADAIVEIGADTPPAGSDTQLQYNNGGSFGGISQLTYNDTNGTIAMSSSHTGIIHQSTASGAGGYALWGEATATTGSNIGVYGEQSSSASSGYGVYGYAAGSSATGVRGEADGTNGTGVQGVCFDSGTGYAVDATRFTATGYAGHMHSNSTQDMEVFLASQTVGMDIQYNSSSVFSVDSAGDVTGTSFNGVALTTGGSATNFLNEQGNYVAAGGGGGNVSNTGTPVNNQLAVWTDATTIEGDANLTFDTSTDTLETVNITATNINLTGSTTLIQATITDGSSLTTAIRGVASTGVNSRSGVSGDCVTSNSWGGIFSNSSDTYTTTCSLGGGTRIARFSYFSDSVEITKTGGITATGAITADSINTDDIVESTTDAGVTIEGLLFKDNTLSYSGSTQEVINISNDTGTSGQATAVISTTAPTGQALRATANGVNNQAGVFSNSSGTFTSSCTLGKGGTNMATFSYFTNSVNINTSGGITSNRGIDKLTHATGSVSVSAATAPTTGQVLTATSSSAATWQSPVATTIDHVDSPSTVTVSNIRTDLTSAWQTVSAGSGVKYVQVTMWVSAATTGTGSIFGYVRKKGLTGIAADKWVIVEAKASGGGSFASRSQAIVECDANGQFELYAYKSGNIISSSDLSRIWIRTKWS